MKLNRIKDTLEEKASLRHGLQNSLGRALVQ